MPIYEYACGHCRKTFEEWLKADDEAHSHPCPHCGQPAPRILSHTSFQLKGGGWYVSEYGYKKSVHEEGAAASSPADAAPAATGSDAAAPAAPAKKEAESKTAPAAPAPAPAPSPSTGAASAAAAPAQASA